MTRDKYTVKFTKPVRSDPTSIRLATPEIVAEYVANRLKTDVIADLGCGIGIQAIFFAKHSEKVYAVDIDSKRLAYAKYNARIYGISNIEFIHGDALSSEVIERLSDVDVIFSDPARRFDVGERRLEDLKPPTLEVIEKYQHITDRMAFHLPPMIDPEKVFFDCEREYLSLEGEINRFTVYLGRLKLCERSAIVLPMGARLESGSVETPGIPENVGVPRRGFIFEPEPSVVRAELLPELFKYLPEDAALYQCEPNGRRLITSETQSQTPFLKACYRVISTTDFEFNSIRRALRECSARGVVLRFRIDPEEYWSVRTMLEANLTGEKTIHLFRCNNTALLCQKTRKEI
ncbi:methyltransferase [Methanosarcinales archaeon]|nr:MAG: methyltransferase [Methanosarcinales archaeon]